MQDSVGHTQHLLLSCYFFFMCRGLKFSGSSSIMSGGTYFTDRVQ